MRDRRIAELRASGLTLSEIAARVNVTRQRVAQIIAAQGGPSATEVTRARRQAGASLARERADEVLELWQQGLGVGEIHERTGVSWRAVRETISVLATAQDRTVREHALAPNRPSPLPLFTDEQLISGLRAVAKRLGHSPTGGEYRQLAPKLRLATHPTVYMRFGSWSGALRAAGLDPHQPPARAYRPRWHVAACWRALVSVADQLGDPPRYRRYVELAAGREDLPSAATLRLRLGLWSQIAAELDSQSRSATSTHSGRLAA